MKQLIKLILICAVILSCTNVALAGQKLRQIAMNRHYVLLVDQNSRIWTVEIETLTKEHITFFDDKNVVHVACGYKHFLALTADGRVYIWGNVHRSTWSDDTHVLGPTLVEGLENIVYVAAGSGFSAALSNNGVLYKWGSNWRGQLGQGHQERNVLSPRAIQGFHFRAIEVHQSYDSFIYACDDRHVYGWGWNLARESNMVAYNSPRVLEYEDLDAMQRRINNGNRHNPIHWYGGQTRIWEDRNDNFYLGVNGRETPLGINIWRPGCPWHPGNHRYYSRDDRRRVETVLLVINRLRHERGRHRLPPRPIVYEILQYFIGSGNAPCLDIQRNESERRDSSVNGNMHEFRSAQNNRNEWRVENNDSNNLVLGQNQVENNSNQLALEQGQVEENNNELMPERNQSFNWDLLRLFNTRATILALLLLFLPGANGPGF